MGWVRRHRLDLVGWFAAVSYGAPSLAYRYGPDQAMFHYVAREWLSGRLPYRDVFDVKPPGIFVLEAVLLALFGESQLVLRVASLFAVVATGSLAAHALGARRSGELGLGAFLAAAWHFGAFDFYHSAQTEVFQSFFLVAGLAAARGERSIGAGLLLGTAVLFKLTAVIPAALAGAVALRLREVEGRAALVALAKLALGGVLPLALFVLSYALVDAFGAGGALRSLGDYLALVAQYGTSAKPALLARLSTFWLENLAWLAIAIVGVWLAFKKTSAEFARPSGGEGRGARAEAVAALVLFSGAVGAVLAQGKLSTYQWDVASGFLIFLLLVGLRPLALRAAWIAAIVLAALPLVRPGAFYGAHVSALLRGAAVEPAMVHPDFLYAYPEQVAMASAIQSRGLRPGDLLHVRGYEPTVYVLTGLSSPARFFENHLHSWWVRDFDALDESKREHYARLGQTAPRFFATRPELPVDVAVLEAAGYERFAGVGRFTLWERVRPGAPAPRWPRDWWREAERRARARRP